MGFNLQGVKGAAIFDSPTVAIGNSTTMGISGDLNVSGHIQADSLQIGKKDNFELFVYKVIAVDVRNVADNKGIVYTTPTQSEIVKVGETPDKTKAILRNATEIGSALKAAGLTDSDVDFVFRKEFSHNVK